MQIFRLIIKKQHYYLLIYRKNDYICTENSSVTCEVTEYLVTKEVRERDSK